MTDLTATRTGGEVRLRWTTPARTTDGVTLEGEIVAEICQSDVRSTQASGSSSCAVVDKVTVHPGESAAVVRLTGNLASGPARPLAYRVQLRGGTGKTAGPGGAAFVITGEAPEQVRGLKAMNSKAGALVEWTPVHSGGSDVVELQRTLTDPPRTGARRTAGASQGLGALLSKDKVSAKAADADAARLKAGPTDSGGVLDRTVVVGSTYQYTAQRVRRAELGGRSLEMRSAPSDPITIVMQDVFAPEPPVGLVAAPGPGSIDLSWEPGVEPGSTQVAGYRVYRRDEGAAEWRLLNGDLTPVPAYRDTSAGVGQKYRYRVTAVDAAGHESGPSAEVAEGKQGVFF